MTKYSEALEAFDYLLRRHIIPAQARDEMRDAIKIVKYALQPTPTSAEVEEAIERCQANENYSSDHPTKWAQFRISDVKTLIQAARQPQKDVREPANEVDDKITCLSDEIMQAIGEASTCWSNLSGAGVFESSKAKKIAERLSSLCNAHINAIRTHSQHKDVSVLVEALEELSQLGHEGMKPDYTQWLTFHDRVAEVSDKALKAFGEVV